MTLRYFALAFGIVFLLVGIAGFIPALVVPFDASHGLAIHASSGRLFGLFPVNALHNFVHIAFGLWGLIAYRSMAGARVYARGVAIIYAVLMVMGIIPALNTTFGLVPIFGHDVWLHGVLAAVAAYFGFIHKTEVEPSSATYRT